MIVNLTPHDVAIYNTSDLILNNGRLYLHEKADMEYPDPLRVYPAAKKPARAIYELIVAGRADRCLIYRRAPREIIGLPEPKTDTYYIVAKMLAQACPERTDLIFPRTVVRKESGDIVGYADFFRV